MIGGGETPRQLELLAVPARGGAGREIVRWRRGAGCAESTAYISTRPRSDVYRWSLLRSSATDDWRVEIERRRSKTRTHSACFAAAASSCAAFNPASSERSCGSSAWRWCSWSVSSSPHCSRRFALLPRRRVSSDAEVGAAVAAAATAAAAAAAAPGGASDEVCNCSSTRSETRRASWRSWSTTDACCCESASAARSLASGALDTSSPAASASIRACTSAHESAYCAAFATRWSVFAWHSSSHWRSRRSPQQSSRVAPSKPSRRHTCGRGGRETGAGRSQWAPRAARDARRGAPLRRARRRAARRGRSGTARRARTAEAPPRRSATGRRRIAR